jgi:hypothetical protein
MLIKLRILLVPIHYNALIIDELTFLKLWYQNHNVLIANVTATPKTPINNVLRFTEVVDPLFDPEVLDVAPGVSPPGTPPNENVPESQ